MDASFPLISEMKFMEDILMYLRRELSHGFNAFALSMMGGWAD